MVKEKIDIWGGIHEATLISLFVDSDTLCKLHDADETDNSFITKLLDSLSKGQKARVKKHMCGVSGCTCGILKYNIRTRRKIFTSTIRG